MPFLSYGYIIFDTPVDEVHDCLYISCFLVFLFSIFFACHSFHMATLFLTHLWMRSTIVYSFPASWLSYYLACFISCLHGSFIACFVFDRLLSYLLAFLLSYNSCCHARSISYLFLVCLKFFLLPYASPFQSKTFIPRPYTFTL